MGQHLAWRRGSLQGTTIAVGPPGSGASCRLRKGGERAGPCAAFSSGRPLAILVNVFGELRAQPCRITVWSSRWAFTTRFPDGWYL